jgi:phage virion morphogenesis protein
MADVIVDDKEVLEALDELVKAGTQLRPAMESIGALWLSRVHRGFDTGTSPTGQPWKPLVAREGQPLRNTGRLRNSITSSAGDDFLLMGTNVEYAPPHQFGYQGPVPVPEHTRRITQAFGKPIEPKTITVSAHTRKANIPARPFFPSAPIPDEWQQDVLTAVTHHLGKVPGVQG